MHRIDNGLQDEEQTLIITIYNDHMQHSLEQHRYNHENLINKKCLF